MTVKEMLKQELVSEIRQLSSYRLQEVLDFVRFLGARPVPAYKRPEIEVDLTKDPILEFIGGVSHGALAQDIDKELYGV